MYEKQMQCVGHIADCKASQQGLTLGRAYPAQGDCGADKPATPLAAAIGAMEASLCPLPALPPRDAYTPEACERYARLCVSLALNRDRSRPRGDGWVLRDEAIAEFIRILRCVLGEQDAPHDAREAIHMATALRLTDWARGVQDTTGHE